jgi:hypothetical protein
VSKYTYSNASFGGVLRTHRFNLVRQWPAELATTGGTLCVIGKNPSIADADKDDPTVRVCVRLAKNLGLNRLEIVNIMAYRSTDPKALLTCDDPVGKGNFAFIYEAVGRANIVLAAWGAETPRYVPTPFWLDFVSLHGWLAEQPNVYALCITKSGHPHHPLRTRLDKPLVRLEPPRAKQIGGAK